MFRYITDTLKKTFDYKGRSSRAEYWVFTLSIVLLFAPVSMVVITVISQFSEDLAVTALFFMLLAIIIPSTSLGVRRLHDIGLSGWFFLAMLIPFGNVFLLITSVIDSKPGVNKWGPNPKGIGNDDLDWKYENFDKTNVVVENEIEVEKNPADELEKFEKLHKEGVLSDEEYEKIKK